MTDTKYRSKEVASSSFELPVYQIFANRQTHRHTHTHTHTDTQYDYCTLPPTLRSKGNHQCITNQGHLTHVITTSRLT